jgi:hypothetical protein
VEDELSSVREEEEEEFLRSTELEVESVKRDESGIVLFKNKKKITIIRQRFQNKI